MDTRNQDSIATQVIDGNQVVILRAGKKHILLIEDQDGWAHHATVLRGAVTFDGSIHGQGDQFPIVAPPGNQQFVAGKGDFVVLVLEGQIFPPGTIHTNPKTP